MKRMLVVIVMFFVLLSSVPMENNFSLNKYFSGEYFVYTNEKISNNSIYLGSCYMTNGVIGTSEVVGESMVLKNYEPGKILQDLKAKIVTSEFLATGTSVIYGYSKLIPRSVEVKNQNVNLQIAVYDDHLVVGWPMILGSF